MRVECFGPFQRFVNVPLEDRGTNVYIELVYETMVGDR